MHGKTAMDRKTVLITGANGGIGLAAAKLFLGKGFFVFAHYNRSSENLKVINSDRLNLIQGDLFYPENARTVFERCVREDGGIDVLVNNAGTFAVAERIEDIQQKEFDYVMAVNLTAPFILSQLAMEHMKKRNFGRIINISSISVKYGGNPKSAPYTISKSALETMTVLFAKAGAPFNVLVNAIRVGVTDTKFHELNLRKDLTKRIDLIPLKRPAEPHEIAHTIYYLAAENSSFITGSILTAAGGE